MAAPDFEDRKLTGLEREIAAMRRALDRSGFRGFSIAELADLVHRNRKRRRPGAGSMPALVEPPRGPRPLQGGAAAPLEMGD
jgi:hypothetical protein